MKQFLEPISKTRSLFNLNVELEMYFCKIYPNVKRNEATPIYSFFFGPSGETARWIGPKCNTKRRGSEIHLYAKFELKIVDANIHFIKFDATSGRHLFQNHVSEGITIISHFPLLYVV